MLKIFTSPIKKQDIVLNIIPYNMDCIVFINNTSEQLNKVLKVKLKSKAQLDKEDCEYLDQKPLNTAHYIYSPTKGIRLVFIKCSTIGNAITCFEHEKVHLLHNILDLAGMKLSDHTEEAYAYLFQEVTSQFLRQIK